MTQRGPVEQVRADLAQAADPQRAANLRRFFKTGPGQYAEGDQFLGVTVPQQRAIVRRSWRAFGLDDVEALLASPWHEERSTALLILVAIADRAPCPRKADAADLYLASTVRVKNWDLVDTSAPGVLGNWLLTCQDSPTAGTLLTRLAHRDNLWERRIAILATFPFIRAGHPDLTLQIATDLLNDPHDLIHKAVGWMLRELGNRDRPAEETFLRQHHRTMPRTMLRYAIEKFDPQLRQTYLRGPQDA